MQLTNHNALGLQLPPFCLQMAEGINERKPKRRKSRKPLKESSRKMEINAGPA
jgi:hypothetical protein